MDLHDTILFGYATMTAFTSETLNVHLTLKACRTPDWVISLYEKVEEASSISTE